MRFYPLIPVYILAVAVLIAVPASLHADGFTILGCLVALMPAALTFYTLKDRLKCRVPWLESFVTL